MLGVVALGDDHGPGLEDEDTRTQFGEFVGRPPAGNAGAHHDDVVFLAARADVHGPRCPGDSGAHPSKVRNEVRWPSAASPTSEVK